MAEIGNRVAKLAKLAANQSWNRYIGRLAERQQQFDIALKNATYQGYDAAQGLHKVQSGNGEPVTVTQPLTNGGLRIGDRVEPTPHGFDSMPRIRRKRRGEQAFGTGKSIVAVLVQKKKLIDIETRFSPGIGPLYSPAVPAAWGQIWYAHNPSVVTSTGTYSYRSEIPPDWVGGNAEPRYALARSDILTGVDFYSDPVLNDNYTSTCTYNNGPIWRSIPESSGLVNYHSVPGIENAGERHYGFLPEFYAGANGQNGAIGSGIVIGGFFYSPDGESSEPAQDASILPRAFQRVRRHDPGSPEDEADPYTWVTCPTSPDGYAGEEWNMNWTFVELFKFGDYRPPQLIRPARPAQYVPVAIYKTQLWLFSSESEPVLLEEFPPREDYEESFASFEAYLSIDESGAISTDYKVSGIPTPKIVHFQDSTQVSDPTNWRKSYTKTFTTQFTDDNPCNYQYRQQQVNLNDAGTQLYRLNPQNVSYQDMLTAKSVEISAYDIAPNTEQGFCEIDDNAPPSATELVGLPSIPKDFELTGSNLHQEVATVLCVVGIVLK